VPTAESLSADPVIALGERILAELGRSRTDSTLTRWLAHHVARLVDSADRARVAGEADADVRASDARAAILQLWQARTAWPSGWPPPSAAELVRLLDGLPDRDCHGSTLLARLQNVHHHVLALLVDLVADDGTVDVEQGWLESFGDRLTPDEAALLRRAALRPRRLDALRRSWDRTEGTRGPQPGNDTDTETAASPTAHPLINLANAYRDTILELFDDTTEVH
jgi:hypothetical protein